MSKAQRIDLQLLDDLARRIKATLADTNHRPTVVGIVRRADSGDLLLVRPRIMANVWRFVDGTIGNDETAVESLVRQLRSQLSLGPKHVALEAYLGEGDLAGRPAQRCFFFAVICSSPDQLTLNAGGLGGHLWCPIGELPDELGTGPKATADLLLQMAYRLP